MKEHEDVKHLDTRVMHDLKTGIKLLFVNVEHQMCVSDKPHEEVKNPQEQDQGHVDGEDKHDRETGQVQGVGVPHVKDPELVFEQGDLSFNALFHVQQVRGTEVIIVQ